MTCAKANSMMADLLLDPAAVSAETHAHVAECEACSRELAELEKTFLALDDWTVPEPNPYFMTRLEARLEIVRREEPQGWWARVMSRFRLNSAPKLAAVSLAAVLVVGGGAWLGIANFGNPVGGNTATPTVAPVVSDLQSMDRNKQLLDQMEALSSDDSTQD